MNRWSIGNVKITRVVELEIAAPNQVRWMTLVTTPHAPIAVAVRTE